MDATLIPRAGVSGTRSVERRPEHRLQFAATLSYRPFQETIDQNGGHVVGRAFRRGRARHGRRGGGAARDGIEMQRGFGFVRGILMGTVGRVQGRLSPVLEEGPLLELQAGQARYYLTVLKR